MLNSGINLTELDPATRPQDDLYRHVNGKWLVNHTLPEDRASDGAFRQLHDQAEEHVRSIVEGSDRNSSHTALLIDQLYKSFMDEDHVNRAGIGALDTDLRLITHATDKSELAHNFGKLQRSGGLSPFGLYIHNDMKNPDIYALYFYQSGLGLPDESYYRDGKYAEIRQAYQEHIARMLGFLSFVHNPKQAAKKIFDIETELASHHWDIVKDRDSTLTYNPTTYGEFKQKYAAFTWDKWRSGIDVSLNDETPIIIREPDFFSGWNTLWQNLSLQDIQLWGYYHLLTSRAAYLNQEIVEANFDFYGKTLAGTNQLRDRWKRGVSLVESVLGEAVGKEYVKRHFPVDHKSRMETLVANLIAAYHQAISELTWMSAETKVKALEKLAAFRPKIGYPDKWRDYRKLALTDNDLLENIRLANIFETTWQLAKIGKPVDRDEWHMTPQTVNAYYNPSMNEIVFPAAILQPPFFSPEVEDAANYGGIGAVIGHEIGHGFDDQGSKYDGQGRLENWWTNADRAEFEKRTKSLIEQYNTFSPEQLSAEYNVNGALTIGENIGDLGGLTIALRAYELSLGGQPAPVVDGLSGLQRVFLSWAQVWQTKMTNQTMIQRIATDPHSPAEFRCNGVVRNIAEYYEAFDVSPEDALYLAPEDRVKIW